jgi:hypothetical protein
MKLTRHHRSDGKGFSFRSDVHPWYMVRCHSTGMSCGTGRTDSWKRNEPQKRRKENQNDNGLRNHLPVP